MRLRALALTMMGAVAAVGTARADEDDLTKADIQTALKDGRRDIAEDLIESAMRRASQSNEPVRLGRWQLFRAELEAEKPTARTIDAARSAMLKLAESPEAAPEALRAEIRYHVSGAQVGLQAEHLGAAALHIQQGRDALARRAKSEPAAKAVLERDTARLGEAERGLLGKLYKLLEGANGNTSVLDAGMVTALAHYTVDKPKPLEAQPGSEEPVAPKARPSGTSLLGKLDHALSTAEERDIAAAEARNDAKALAAARSRHAETLLRLGKRDEALKARREALAYYREKGRLDQVLGEDRWIAEQAGKDKKAALVGRRAVVEDIERTLSVSAGPARTAMLGKYRADYLAFLDAVIAVQPPAAKGKEGKDTKDAKEDKEVSLEVLRATELVRDRVAWDDVNFFGDAARWKRVVKVAPELRRTLDEIAREHASAAGETMVLDDPSAAAARSRQTVCDALVKGDAATQGLPPLDLALLADRLHGRALLAYARTDAEHLAITVVPAKGAPRVTVVALKASDEIEAADALRKALAPATSGDEGGDAWRAPAAKLYAGLVQPVERSIAGAEASGWVVVPDGTVAALPFAALVDGAGKTVGERVSLSFFPSLWAVARAARKVDGKAALVLGAARYTEPGLAPLPSAEKESAAMVRSLVAAGRQAKALPTTSGADKLLADTGSYDVVHVTTRSRLDGEAPALSYLALAQGRLFGFELAMVGWHANVVALDGAGANGLGAAGAARGLSGLIAGALRGPAATVVASEWPAEGASSAALMTRFYELYADGKSPAVALAGAQQEMATGKLDQPLLNMAGANPMTDGKRFMHPRYWAPYVAWGD